MASAKMAIGPADLQQVLPRIPDGARQASVLQQQPGVEQQLFASELEERAQKQAVIVQKMDQPAALAIHEREGQAGGKNPQPWGRGNSDLPSDTPDERPAGNRFPLAIGRNVDLTA